MKKPYTVLLMTSIMFVSCHKKIELVNSSQTRVDAIQNNILKKDNKGVRPKGVKDVAKNIKQTLVSCAKNDIFKRDIIYLGPTSNYYLGHIFLDDRTKLSRTDLKDITPAEDLKKFVTFGNESSNCSAEISKAVTTSLEGQIEYPKKILMNLGFSFESEAITNLKLGTWRIDDLNIDLLGSYLDTATDEKLKQYYQIITYQKAPIIKTSKNYQNSIVVRCLVVKGFSVGVKITKSANVDLSATAAVDEKNHINYKFKLDSDKNVVISTESEVYILGQIPEIKR